MLWVGVFAGIAVAGLVMLGCYVVWLARKVGALLAELGSLAEITGELADLVDQIELPEQRFDPQRPAAAR